MALESRDVTLDVTIRAHTEEAKRASRSLSDVEKEAARAAKGMDGLSDESKLLNAQIEKSTSRVKELEKALALVGDDHEIRKAIRSERSWLAELEKSAKDLLPEAEKLGGDIGEQIIKGAGGAIQGAASTPILGPAIAGAIIGALPSVSAVVGGALGGAITSAAAIGGIAGGIFAASKDPSVKAAAAEFGHTISGEFFGSGQSFVEPIKKSLGLLAVDFAKLNLGHTFELAAPLLEKFAAGIGDFAIKLMPGFNKAIERAGPFVDTLALGLGNLGNALGGFLDDSSKSHGSIEGLAVLMNGLSGTVAALGHIINWTSERLHDFNVASGSFFYGLGALGNAVGKTDNGFQGFGKSLTGYAQGSAVQAIGATIHFGDSLQVATDKSNDLAAATKEVNDQLNQMVHGALSADEALISVAKGFNDLATAIAENGKAWDGNSEAALNNRAAVNSQLEKLLDARDAAIANGDTIETANRAYEAGVKQLLAYAAAAGATKAELDKLAQTYIVRVEIASSLAEIGQAIGNSFKGIEVGGGLAGGGEAKAGTTYLTGEEGPELVTFGKDGHVWPNGTGPGGGGGGPTQIVVSADPSASDSRFIAALLQMLRFEIRAQGGGLAVLGLKA